MEINSKRTSHSSSLSGDLVASNGYLSTEILLRLPIRSLLRSKCVSRLWQFLITDPRFIQHRNSVTSPNPNPKSPSGLFLERPTQLAHPEYDFVPFDVGNPVTPPFKTLSFDKDASTSGISVLHSSNGLMLCHSLCVDLFNLTLAYRPKYYVYNPTVNQFTVLPKYDGWHSRSIRGMTLAFNPWKSTDYRVVCVRTLESISDDDDDCYQIDVYSSETRKWRVSGEPFPSQHDTEFMAGVYWNDAIHWFNKEGFVSYFKLDHESLHDIPVPNIQTDLERTCNRLVDSRDCMLLIDVYGPHTCRFNVFEMTKDYSGWQVRYKVDLEKVTEVYPEMYPHGYIFAVHCLVLGEKEEDSFVVVEIPGKAIRFNLKLETFYKLCDFVLPSTGNEVSIGDGVLMFGRWQYGRWPGAFLFTESLSVA